MARARMMSKILRTSTKIVSDEGGRVKWSRASVVAIQSRLWLLRLLSAMTFALVSFFPPRALAAPFDPQGKDWEGYSDFVRLVRDEIGSPRLIVTNRLDWRTLTPDDALILVYPERGADTGSCGAFVRAGGRVALFDDFGAGDDLLTSFDIRRVPLPAHPLLALRDNPDLAIAGPGPDAAALTQGVDRVVTNHATGLSQPLLTTVLQVRGTDDKNVALALALSSGSGRLLAVGDPSILMNSMLRYPGNHELARNVASYLTTGHPSGHVTLVIGRFSEIGSFAGAASAEHEVLSTLQRTAGAVGRDGLPTWVMYWLAFVITVAVLVWLVPRATRVYRSASHGPPR